MEGRAKRVNDHAALLKGNAHVALMCPSRDCLKATVVATHVSINSMASSLRSVLCSLWRLATMRISSDSQKATRIKLASLVTVPPCCSTPGPPVADRVF